MPLVRWEMVKSDEDLRVLGEEYVIEVSGVSKKYGWFSRHDALKDLSFQVRKGRVCGLLGPNGAGKTTVIKSILGLVKPDRGTLTLLGKSKLGRQELERIGFLPEESYLYPFLTIKETLLFAADLYENPSDLKKKIPELLELVGLGGAESRKISQCSKGMRRRTALAQALIHDPDIMILDEPTSGFDPLGIAMMKSVIMDLKHRGKTVLICSHQLRDIEGVCDDIVILLGGKAIVQGALDDLLSVNRWSLELEKEADVTKMKNWMANEGILAEFGVSRDLERFFVEAVRPCSSNS